MADTKSQEQGILNPEKPPLAEKPNPQEALALYKMEYEKCADRYDNIYKAVWTNFSYMVVVAGGILTFASARFPNETIVFFAALPLIFWFWATFVPMNAYGDQVGKRLTRIETTINRQFQLASSNSEGLNHFTDFEERQSLYRVRTAVWISSIILHLIALAALGCGMSERCRGTIFRPATTPEIRVITDSKLIPVEVGTPTPAIDAKPTPQNNSTGK
jgi:hypothetical protein